MGNLSISGSNLIVKLNLFFGIVIFFLASDSLIFDILDCRKHVRIENHLKPGNHFQYIKKENKVIFDKGKGLGQGKRTRQWNLHSLIFSEE